MNKTKRIFSCVIAIIFIVALIPTLALAADTARYVSQDEEEAIIEKINEEYGTNIHKCTEEELIKYGIDLDEYYSAGAKSRIAAEDFEAALRDVAENVIPEIEEANAYAEKKIKENAIAEKISLGIPAADESSTSVVAAANWYSRSITYATALIQATPGRDSYNNKIWDSVTNRAYESNYKNPNSFLADPTTLTGSIIDGRRTATWSGYGDYCKYIDGQLYYVSSGSQYTEFYAPNFT